MTRYSADSLIHRHFYNRSQRARVILTQIPLSLTVVLMAGHAAAFYPASFDDQIFVAGLWMHGAILALCVLVPWDRLPRGSFLAVPYLDFVAVGFTREGSLQFATSVGLLVLFPVFWLAASGLARKAAIVSSALATLMIVWLPQFLGPDPVTLVQLGQPLIFPFMMAAFAGTVAVITASMSSQRQAVASKDAQLREALAASRQREQLLAAVVDTVAVGLVVVDAGGHDQLINSTQQNLHALALPKDVSDAGERDLLVFGPDRHTSLDAEARPVRRAVNGESFTNYQVWIGDGDTAKAVSTTARPIQDGDGGSAGAVIAFHDVTEMMAALAAKEDFVSNVSHEFRTPLTSIQGYLGLVLDESDRIPAHLVQYLEVAERNTARLSSLVADLLTSDSMTINPSATDVGGIIAESLATMRPAAAKNGVELINEAPAAMPAMVDGGRFGQALDNLISNAVKYSPDGGTVTVRARVVDTDFLCEVQDTGMGMNSAEQAAAFTKFFRAESALERSIPGLGLGLMITRTIIVKHGGTITVESERNVGTTMRIVLPGCILDSALDQQPSAAELLQIQNQT